MAARAFVCRGRSYRNNFGVFGGIFDIFKLLGQRRHITIQAPPTLDVLAHDQLNTRAKVGSSGLPNAWSTKVVKSYQDLAYKLAAYGYSIWFGVKEKAKRGPPNLLIVHNYATKSENAEKLNLKRGRIIKEGGDFPKLLFSGNRDYLIKYNGQQGDRAYFHTTRISSRRCKISPYLKRGDKMKLELRLNNTLSGFWMHYIVPVEIKGKQVVRFYNDNLYFVNKWLPYTTLMVKNLPADLRAVMDQYWLLPPDEGTDHDNMQASLMLHCGVHLHNYLPLFDNYWEETVKIALPFVQENKKHYFGKILEDFPRGGTYCCNEFVKGLSRIAGKEVAVEFKDDVYPEALGFMLMFDEEKRLMNHPEHGIECPSHFDF